MPRRALAHLPAALRGRWRGDVPELLTEAAVGEEYVDGVRVPKVNSYIPA
jgi:hypothetical protein